MPNAGGILRSPAPKRLSLTAPRKPLWTNGLPVSQTTSGCVLLRLGAVAAWRAYRQRALMRRCQLRVRGGSSLPLEQLHNRHAVRRAGFSLDVRASKCSIAVRWRGVLLQGPPGGGPQA